MQFKALVSTVDGSGQLVHALEVCDTTRLPEGDVLVAVEWAGLNYKDAM